VARIERGTGAATEFPQRYAHARGDVEKLVALLAWCLEKNLKLEKEFVACNLLTLDASNERARSAAGLTPFVLPAIEKTIEVVASDVISRTQVFADVVGEMRRRTVGLAATGLPPAPAKFARCVGRIQNPLTFDPERMPVPDAAEIETWWRELSVVERRDFARYYGLWCAFVRGQK
jgi:hypothetical protein